MGKKGYEESTESWCQQSSCVFTSLPYFVGVVSWAIMYSGENPTFASNR